ncbi:hypothetical protein [Porphyromonas endodontalis]|jgi:putative lipoprotein|uniref:hypothetical protein n=1 Tax=Porphyromonas endodontalis TaxID=28124 RepID=UPI0028EC654F|nr:hypothetical protein [Porphyromonas endodontalis]
MSRSKLLVVAVFCCITLLFVGCLPPQSSLEQVKWEEENPKQQTSLYAVYGFRLIKPEIELLQKKDFRMVFLEYRHKIPIDYWDSLKETKEEAKRKAHIVCSDDSDKRALFDSIARSYGDIWYPHPSERRLLYTQVYNVDKVTNISVFALEDWSDRYPKGSCMDDNFKFISGSPDSYIRNGYHLDSEIVDKAKAGFEYWSWTALYDDLSSSYVALPVCGKLSEIDFNQYDLLGYYYYLGLLEPIEQSAHPERQIAVEITYKDGTKSRLTASYCKPSNG